MPHTVPDRSLTVRDTQILATDTRDEYRQKLARVALDEMYQFVGVLDAEGTLLEVNRAALEGVGLTRADMEGKPFWECFWWAVSKETQETLRESVARAARGEFVRYDVEIYGRAGGRETIIIDFSIIPVKDHEGRVVFLVPEGRDITAKKAHEREIAQKNIDLQGLLERIRELDEIKTQVFANVSHELRTPLALILGPAQRLLDDDASADPAQRRECAHAIVRSARILLKRVNDLLDISKLEAGKLRIELQDVDVAKLVRFMASHFSELATERGIDFEVQADAPCRSAVDPDKFQRVLMNLLANAFKFVPDGGRVRCALEQTPRELTVTVEDSGPGVEPELRQAIFERFRQGDGGNSRKTGGTGLGLAIAREFIEMHRGRIEVLDSPLGGARFRITLPVHDIITPAEPGTAVPERSFDHAVLEGLVEELRPVRHADDESVAGLAEEKPRVLVVEDNPDMNRFVSQCLSAEYQVLSAFDGREGLDRALEFRPSLVVSDIMMPNVSGDEMVAEMRKRPELREVPILLLSAKADDELKIRLLEHGAQDFIVKPFSEQDLRVRVRNLVVAHEARRALAHALEREHEARAAADRATRAKDEFMAMLGHELRSPLAPIVTAVELLRLRGGDAIQRERMVIERQVSNLRRLVDDLLDVSRVTRGKVELKLEPVEMAEVVAKAIELSSPMLEDRRQELSTAVPSRGMVVHGDPTRLAQVVSNLLTNASKYGRVGGTVHVGARREEQQIVLTVDDDGSGIAPELLPHVFDLFTQDERRIDRSQGGLGLGLAIVKRLVTLHGGTVEAHSEGLDRGSRFVVRLPAAPSPSSGGEASAPDAGHGGTESEALAAPLV